MDYRTFIVDRLEGGTAVLINGSDPSERLEVSAGIFPDVPREGMTFRVYEDGRMEEDREASSEREKRISGLMDSLFEKD